MLSLEGVSEVVSGFLKDAWAQTVRQSVWAPGFIQTTGAGANACNDFGYLEHTFCACRFITVPDLDHGDFVCLMLAKVPPLLCRVMGNADCLTPELIFCSP